MRLVAEVGARASGFCVRRARVGTEHPPKARPNVAFRLFRSPTRGVAPAGEQLPHRHRGGRVLLTQAPQLRVLQPRLDDPLAVANATSFSATARALH